MGTGKSVEYFPHDCNAKDDPKIMIMMAQLGLEAYGIYWILVEYLRDQPGYRAPMLLLDPLSRRYGSSREKFEAIVTKFNLFEYNDEYFVSPSLVRRMEPMEKKREQQRLNIKKRWNKDTNVLPPYNDGNTDVIQSKVEKSIVKKSKVKESKEEKSKNNTPTNFDTQNQLLVQKWYDWCDFRKLLKKPYKTTTGSSAAYNKLCTLANNNSELAIAIINQSMENEWVGFFPLKTTNNFSKNSIPGEDPVDRVIREQKEYFKLHPITETDGTKK